MGEALPEIEKRPETAVNIRCLLGEMSTTRAWYAVQTGYRHEQKVAANLTTKGFETYLPMLTEVRQWKDRKKKIEIPAFGGYLFVRHELTLGERVRILETAGVVKLLGDNHRPVPVPNFEIDALRQALGSGILCERHEIPEVGTLVRVKRGALAGIQGTLLRIKSGLRLVLAVATVAQAISVEVMLEDVESLPSVPGQ